jgi:hypothetical protein
LRRRNLVLLGVSLVATLGVLFAVPASADTQPVKPPQPSANGGLSSPLVVVARRHAPAISGTTTAPDIAVGDINTCTANIQYPHHSGHVPGTVNVVMTVSCTSGVVYIQADVQLYYVNIAKVADSGLQTTWFNNFAYVNAANTCVNGTYQGWGYMNIYFGPNYEPSSGSSSGWGPINFVTCA